jgi:hypothetical protein
VSCLVIILPDAALAVGLLAGGAFAAAVVRSALLETRQRRQRCQSVSTPLATGRCNDSPSQLDEQSASSDGLQPRAAAATEGRPDITTRAAARRVEHMTPADDHF